MAISYYAEVTRETPAAKNKAGQKVRYDIRVFYVNDDNIQQMGGIGLIGNTGDYAKVSTYSVKDLSYGAMLTSSETGSHGTGAKFSVDVTPNTSGTYTPGFYVEVYDPGLLVSTLKATSVASALHDNPALIPITFAIPSGGTVKIPTIQATKAPVIPDMPPMLKGINIDTDQSGLDKRCGGFQYDSCRKRWITIWITHRYVNPKTHAVATSSQAAAIDAGQGPKGFNKQYGYEIEGILDSVARDPANSTKTFSQLSKSGKTLHNLNKNSIGKWDWASNNMPYDPPGTGTSMGSWKTATETAYRSFINGNCNEVPPPGNNNSSTVPPTPISLDTLVARFNPPPHITTRHFSPIADPEGKVFK